MGGPYHPYLPDALADCELLLSPSCASAVADAQEALARLELSGSRIDTEPLARMMLRAEAVSSSRIEGLEMPAGKLLEYEELDRLGVDHRLDGTEAQILGNLHTLVDGLARAVAGSPLTVEEVCELNRVLLTGTRLAERGGVIRAEQNWIGGNRVNPVGAAYVPPLSRCRAGSYGRPRRLRQSQRAPSHRHRCHSSCSARDHSPLCGRQRTCGQGACSPYFEEGWHDARHRAADIAAVGHRPRALHRQSRRLPLRRR